MKLYLSILLLAAYVTAKYAMHIEITNAGIKALQLDADDNFDIAIAKAVAKYYNITGFTSAVALLAQLTTSDTMCDNQATYYLWDVMPLLERYYFLKNTHISVDLRGPTNWNNLPESVKESVTAFTSKFLPMPMSVCLSKARMQDLVCAMFADKFQKYMQSQLNFVVAV